MVVAVVGGVVEAVVGVRWLKTQGVFYRHIVFPVNRFGGNEFLR